MEINEIVRDFQRRYDQGFVWVADPNGEENLFHVDSITADRKNIATLALSSPEYGKIILNHGTAHTLRFKYPPVGVYQNGKDAYIFRRVPARQWKHAIYNGNSQVVPVFHRIVPDLVAEGVHRHNTVNFDDVLAAFNGVQYNFADAVKMLGTNMYRSVALRNHFALCLSPDSENYILLFWDTPVARIDQSGKLILVLEKLYEAVIPRVMES